MIRIDTSASLTHEWDYAGIIPAGYDPSCFNGEDDLKPVSSFLARADRLGDLDAVDLEELEEATLADGKTSAELEALALRDELTAAATEAALELLNEALRGLCIRHHACPTEGRLGCNIVRACFRRGAMLSMIKRLRRRCTRLRRAADGLSKSE
ncbi:hypothetical protein ACE103_17640 [Bradyrhizobium sp. ma5]|uniref:hypothetical protein n=1 Tax=Bradyrhizobium sp. ma5 TaxID=3344828 RepID=UPI0035D477A7